MLVLCLALLGGCKEEKGTSLYPPTSSGNPTPSVTGVTLNTPSALAGVTILTITGTNFSTKNEENRVFFDAVQATTLTSSATTLTVRVPNLVKDAVSLKVNTVGAASYSNSVFLNIAAAVSEFGGLTSSEEPVGIACDTAGNVYVSLQDGGSGRGIRQYIDATGAKDTFALANGVTFWTALKMGPGGLIFGARNQRALYTMAKGGAPVLYKAVSGANFYDLDFDNAGNIWTGGADTLLYRITIADQSVKTYAVATSVDTINVHSVRVYNGNLYVATKVNGTEAVYQYPILPSGDLGTRVKYFDLSAQSGYTFSKALAVTFNSDGDMYLGTDAAAGVLLVHPNGSFEPFYSGLFKPSTLLFAWGKKNSSTLYAVRTSSDGVTTKTMFKINTLKTGAPYYGRGDN